MKKARNCCDEMEDMLGWKNHGSYFGLCQYDLHIVFESHNVPPTYITHTFSFWYPTSNLAISGWGLTLPILDDKRVKVLRFFFNYSSAFVVLWLWVNWIDFEDGMTQTMQIIITKHWWHVFEVWFRNYAQEANPGDKCCMKHLGRTMAWQRLHDLSDVKAKDAVRSLGLVSFSHRFATCAGQLGSNLPTLSNSFFEKNEILHFLSCWGP